MRIRLFLAAISLGAATPAFAQEPVFTPEAVKAHVDFLADDLLEGRNAGTRGFDVAARYVSTRFEMLGLDTAAGNTGWYQQVPLSEFSLDPARPASVTIGGKRFANGRNILMGPNPLAGDGSKTVAGNVVFVGYGLEADYAGRDVTGKFVVALLGIPKGMPAEVSIAASKEAKLETASKHGAVGIVSLVTPQALASSFPWAQVAESAIGRETTWLGPNGAPGAGSAEGVKLQVYLDPVAARALFAGAPVSADALFASVAKGERPRPFALKQKLSVTRAMKVRNFASPNVIGVLRGSDPKLADEYVVLSAHLDHEGVDKSLPGPDKIYNGAMDNAAGVATMLEVARAFSENGKRPKRSILFVALTAEEDGLLGSDYLAHYPVVGAGRVVADVNLDMPILLYDFKDVVAFGAEHSTMGPIVEKAAARMGVTLSPDPMPQENLFVRSDHYSFVRAGVPSVFLVTGFANGGQEAFTKFLATNYHKVSDQPDLPFDWAAGAKFAKINYLIAREIADGADAPRWYEGNAYGDKFAPGQPRAKAPKAEK
jgi:hypothetical protein